MSTWISYIFVKEEAVTVMIVTEVVAGDTETVIMTVAVDPPAPVTVEGAEAIRPPQDTGI